MAAALSTTTISQALSAISAADARVAALIQRHGPPEKLYAKTTRSFPALVRSILYQQLAGKAAACIHGRFLTTCGVTESEDLTPEQVLAADPQLLRVAGLSERKVQYVTDLATHFTNGTLSEQIVLALPEEDLEASLTRVKGVGPWTVHMFAMFHLGRPDVLPVGDLGVRKGVQELFKLKELPSPAQMETLTAHWRPWRSIGCYYMWRVAEELPVTRSSPGSKGRNRQQQAPEAADSAAATDAPAAAAAAAGASAAAGDTNNASRQSRKLQLPLTEHLLAAAASSGVNIGKRSSSTTSSNTGSGRGRKRQQPTSEPAAAMAAVELEPDQVEGITLDATAAAAAGGGPVEGAAAAEAVGGAARRVRRSRATAVGAVGGLGGSRAAAALPSAAAAAAATGASGLVAPHLAGVTRVTRSRAARQ